MVQLKRRGRTARTLGHFVTFSDVQVRHDHVALRVRPGPRRRRHPRQPRHLRRRCLPGRLQVLAGAGQRALLEQVRALASGFLVKKVSKGFHFPGGSS
jgi:hypothetical protein